MAGDHKCPVCSSTFTRPQHVARHMRSHTGDRPYKCVHCGDQFARSDLLSRHVNKCHASVKPPTTTQPARRKGHPQPGSSSAAGVRGPALPLIPPPGTRKICDSCAHSRTPAQCDSALPCGKCLQRNSKCTYLQARPPPDLLPIPTSSPPLTVPSMAPPLFPTQPDFNFTVPLYPQSLDPRSYRPDPSFNSNPPSLSVSAGTSESVESPTSSEPSFMLSHIQPHPYPSSQVPPENIQQYTNENKSLDQAYLGQQFETLPDFLYPSLELSHEQSSRMNGHQPQYRANAFYNEPSQRNDLTSVFQHVPPFLQSHQQPPGDFPTLKDGGFFSAFGRMSLDDPALAAEMSKNNSFFAPSALARKQIGHTPGREANMTELRDFWKAFMRDNTPGEKLPQPLPSQIPTHAANGRPPVWRSLSKMASLPDIKTPPAVDPTAAAPQFSTTEEARHPQSHPHLHPPALAEDLTSYQQAVLSRKMPELTLALPQHRGKRPSFKRLASQTLGPFESKSAKVAHTGADAGAYDGWEERGPSGGAHEGTSAGQLSGEGMSSSFCGRAEDR